ncbi:MAG: hypothetical protein ABIO63_02490 [Casimicrobiaceae bacterium]
MRHDGAALPQRTRQPVPAQLPTPRALPHSLPRSPRSARSPHRAPRTVPTLLVEVGASRANAPRTATADRRGLQ